MKYIFSFIFLFLFYILPAQEEILSYHSDIQVNKNRSISVKETIKVKAEGINIQRGIFRDIPNVMLDQNDNEFKVDIEFEEVLLDGNPVNWSVEGISNGKRVKIGDADIFLDPGEYTYTIQYTMSDQVRMFEQYDELYWNVTGNQWMFRIKTASTTITLPEGAKILQHAAYSGGYGESGCACTGEKIDDRTLRYQMNEYLGSYEGITVAVGWDKGFVDPPTEAELRARELRKQLPMIIMVAGLILTFLYYFFAWIRVGRDPDKGAIIPRFEAPDGFSPAASRYVLKMGFDNKAFAASIVSMAIKGFLKIDKTGRNYELIKVTDDETILAPGERKIARKIFSSGDKLEIKQSNHSTLSSAIEKLRSHLKTEFRKVHFEKNKGWLAPGIILTIVSIIASIVLLADQEDIFITLILCSFFSLFLIPIGMSIYKAFKNGSLFKKVLSLLGPLIMIGFVIYAVFNLYREGIIPVEYIAGIVPYVVLFLAFISLNLLFNYLIQAPTVMGRQKMDEIEGLKMYMEVAEKHRLDKMNPPKETPQLFEKLLPFAIALGVENAWSDRFHSIIEKAIAAGDYNPTWYHGPHGYMHMNRISRDLGTGFSSSISSASISPQSSSSSGSGGGGFSGGGGGGGGGGGW